ncbi:MAG: hypothetical protein IPL49_21375 [Saprospirales bacterium]|nr:hypothetical protein [Saprospirales bacterium]MBK8493358.1 hypothetical protein [Saprospirales bacterium]
MKKTISEVQKSTFSVIMSMSLFALIFLFAGIGQAAAQTDAAVAASPYGGKIFKSAPVASEALQVELPALYTQLSLLVEGTKAHKRKGLEILCYKGILSDVTGGAQVAVAYEENLAIFSNALNMADQNDLNFLRSVQSTLFNLLTN